jgi:hypothetical protein
MFFIVHMETALDETLKLNLNFWGSDRCYVLVLWWQVYCDATSRYKERDLKFVFQNQECMCEFIMA